MSLTNLSESISWSRVMFNDAAQWTASGPKLSRYYRICLAPRRERFSVNKISFLQRHLASIDRRKAPFEKRHPGAPFHRY